MGSNKASAASLLRDVFGFDDFRPGQEEIVEAVARGENTLAIMPTGGGKSLCFQLPALMQDGVTVVISPLIALMRDQVRALQASGVAAGALTSGNSPEETEMVWNALQQRKLKLLYITPERLSAGSSLGMLRNIGVSMIAVDEAHCISQWGHDFRPDYLRIGELRRTLNVPLAAFTATADAESRVEIVEKLFDGVRPRTFLHGFDRPNIHLAFTVKNSPRTQILNFVNARKGQSGIIYCGTRAKTETLALGLREVGHASIYYHGGMDGEDRRIAERRFQQEDGLIVVATVAFGMGIDKPDIRWVAHADLPKSVESYYQEIGRAGRDGHPAETLTLFGPEDIKLRRSQIDEGLAPAERRMADHARLNALLGLAEALECRRKTLLNYFGETKVNCNHCDLCQNPPEVFDGTTAVRKALSAMLRTEERFGSGHLIDILLGNETEKIRQRAHTKLPTFGIGKEYTRVQWQTVFRQMMGHDLVRPDADRYGALRMTDAALPILRGLASINLRRDTIKAAVRRPTVTSMLSEEHAPLLSALKAKRRGLAEVANVPAYIIFPDRTLIEMAERRPKNLDQMARVNGVGAKKLQNFGEAFLKVINNEVEPLHPTRRKLAGRKCGALFDKLMKVQTDLARGSDGTGKPLSCSASQLAKVAQLRPDDNVAIERVLGDRKAERFGSAFLDVLRNAG
ncbi:MAG: DNA helicase RecQ [Tateyamaria sp.]|jgi:ATP-dependent DNA helicase RecQ|nr:DNA helicase RecQ [Tateyamaria sp.]MDG0983530.1 DNA helicase RecQ [Tateyamaria sp.]MDG1420547.1 DNA helicase RecQ [Tateyamaria sp.]